ncbi:MAG: nuclear transport factor 2 family protein [Bacteroidia bacterium]|nr:nuclear transport factor 2 family protein [Bacteroidia bacterium]
MSNKELLQQFYSAFSEGNAERMVACYHDNVTFEDPAFGVLRGDEAKGMWRMLLSRRSDGTTIEAKEIRADGDSGTVVWMAEYTYGPKKRHVVNHITGSFRFADGKIIDHRDHFDMWAWTRQALGLSGYLLGWSSFMKKKVQATTNKLLQAFLAKEKQA